MKDLRRALRPIARLRLLANLRLIVAKARLVRNPVRFACLEFVGHGRAAKHRLRRVPVTVSLRHGTRDTDVLLEIHAAYVPPPGVVLPETGLVLDLGANIGLFALIALCTLRDCTVLSFEPDPTNLPLLRRNVALNAFADRWRISPGAVSNRDGEVSFGSGGFADSRISTVGDVRVPLVDLFALPPAALAKIDIEGSEWDILRDPRLGELQTAVLVMEWHQQATDGTTGDASEAVSLLSGAGFRVAASYHERGREHGTIWAVKSRGAATEPGP